MPAVPEVFRASRATFTVIACVVLSAVVVPRAEAQNAGGAAAEPECRVLCAPEFLVEPTFTVEPLFDGEARETIFELIFALDIPTRLPWLGLTLEAAVAPFGRTDTNPFTGPVPGGGDVRDNPVQLESELHFNWLPESWTRGWVTSHFDLVDQFSPAAREGDGSVYTHKFDLELDTAVHAFKGLSDGHWLRDVELEASLDYLATGKPPGESGWSLSFVVVIPVAGP